MWPALLLAIVPHDFCLRESVDLVEINHFYDERGHLVFDQTIFYDWCECEERYQVRAWRLVKNSSQIPRFSWRSRTWESLWLDGEQLRMVTSPHFRETWTQFDPELAEREVLPKERRRELSGSVRKSSR